MIRAIIALMLLAAPAFAQQAAPDQAALNTALSEKLVSELNENIQLRAVIADLRKQLADAKAKEEKAK